MEERKEVKTIKVDYKCPKCKTGYLRSTGMVFTTDPPLFPHICNNPECGYGETFRNIKYPYVEYEAIS